ISDGKADAGRVRLGEMGAPPAEMPFMIAEGYDGAVPDPRGGYAIASRLVWASRASDDIDGIVDPLRPSANVARRIRARVTTGDESTSELVHRYLQGAGN
ncbi:hypothetical protein K8I61_04160, partial [bacterium]|nr:hypothetical protein [bacterium]